MAGEEKRINRRMDLPATLTLTIIKTEYGRDLPPFDVEITDASISGIGFKCDEQLMIGEMFHGVLKIWTKRKMEITLKVIRSKVEDVGYSYGCTFVGVANADVLGIAIYEMFNYPK